MAIRAYRAGFVTTDTPANIICLTGNALTNHYATPQKAGAAWAVPAGETFYIGKILLQAGAANVGIFYLGYGDTSVGNDSAGAPTNEVQMIGSLLLATANVAQEFNVLIPIPTGKYVSFRATGNGVVLSVFGISHA